MNVLSLYSRAIPTKRRLYVVILSVVLTLVVIVGVLVSWLMYRENQAAYAAKAPGVSSKILFAGDIYWGRDMHLWSNASPLKTAYPFSGLAGFHKENYDAWVGNLECPAVPGLVPTDHEERKQLKFNCSTDYMQQFAKWFNVVSLANNHTGNHGSDGLARTRQELDKHQIQYFGHYDPGRLEQVCEVVSLPVRFTMGGKEEQGVLPFAFCGYNGVKKTPSEASLKVIRAYAKHMPVIAYPHMGSEYKAKADQKRARLYREMIDNGADAVLGSHPHWVQNSEAYEGKLIVYSMGNFIFDQQFSTNVMRSAIITLDLKSTGKLDREQLAAWLKVGPACRQFADTCLHTIEQQGLKRLPLSLKFGMQATDNTNKLTKPADAKLTKTVAGRLDWNETAVQLKPAGVLNK